MQLTIEQAKALSADGHPLKPTVDQWTELLNSSKEVKHDRFGKYAEEAAKFYDGNHDWMWKEEYALRSKTGGFLQDTSADVKMPMFQMSVNRAFEAVALFGPALYHQNPNVQVTLHQRPEITPEALGISPQDQFGMQYFAQVMSQESFQTNVMKTHASILQTYSNWLQQETDKKTEARRAINEAIIKGMSLLWTELYRPPGSAIQFPRSVYVSVDDLLVDPDAKYWKDVQWVARRCVHPVNLVEKKYGLPAGILRGQIRSKEAQSKGTGARASGVKLSQTREKTSFDLIEYYEVYSKNGFGDRLRRDEKASDKDIDFSPFGDFTYLVIAPGVPYPLNLPTWDLRSGKPFEELTNQVQWPIPFWADPNCDGGWPFSRIWFYENPNCVWPISLFKPCISELRFVNWCMSFLADKVADSCTTYIAALKSAGAEIQKQLTGPQAPYKWIEISESLGKAKIQDIVSILQTPNFPEQIWMMVSQVLELIDKRTGLTELVYGMTSRQIRSAREADVKESATNIRPDDMASRTEDFLSATAAKEIQAARWSCEGQDVQHVLGQIGTVIWDEQILTQDYDNLVRDFNFRVEAGSARKPNKNARLDNLNQFGQTAVPVMQELVMAGKVGPWNAYVRDVARALDIDPEPYMIEPPQPQEQGPSEEEVKAQMYAQSEQLKLQFKEAENAQEIRHSEERHDVEMEQLAERGALELQNARSRAAAASRNGRSR